MRLVEAEGKGAWSGRQQSLAFSTFFGAPGAVIGRGQTAWGRNIQPPTPKTTGHSFTPDEAGMNNLSNNNCREYTS